MKQQIKGIMFDLGRILVGYDLLRFAQAIRDSTGEVALSEQEVVEIVFRGESYKKYERGLMSTEEFYNETVNSLNIPELTLGEFEEAFCTIFFPNKGIREVLNSLSGKKIFFVSNLSKLHWESYFVKNELIQDFFPEKWQQVLSFKVQTQKPEKKIFEIALSQASLDSKEVLFLDDKLENIEGFRNMGGNAERYSCMEHEIKYLKDILKNYNL